MIRSRLTGRFVVKYEPGATIGSAQEVITVRTVQPTVRGFRHPGTGRYISQQQAKDFTKQTITDEEIQDVVNQYPNLVMLFKSRRHKQAKVRVHRQIRKHLRRVKTAFKRRRH